MNSLQRKLFLFHLYCALMETKIQNWISSANPLYFYFFTAQHELSTELSKSAALHKYETVYTCRKINKYINP